MSKAQQARAARLPPGGVPRWVRVYDNEGETIDRYTVVFTGNYAGHPRGSHNILAMSGAPFHPQGFCQHAEGTDTSVGRWPPAIGRRNHLGRRIRFEDLPEDCRLAVMRDYREVWGL